MTALKARELGAWKPTTTAGSVRTGGDWSSFTPGDGVPELEALAWANPVPNLTNASDGAGDPIVYTMGIRFHLLQAATCHGVRWRVPDTVTPAPAGGHQVSLWNAGTSAQAALKTFTPTPGVYQDVLFDTPVDLVAAPQEYVAAVTTVRYVHRAPDPASGWLVESPSLNVRGDKGRLVTGPTAAYPSSGSDALYYVSPLVAVL